jgi:hypothetical protein
MTDASVKRLSNGVLLDSTIEYIGATEKRREEILHELRSDWLCFLTNGISVRIARQLENNFEEIKKRFDKEEFNLWLNTVNFVAK